MGVTLAAFCVFRVQELVLDRNRIRYIDPDAFAGLSSLHVLRMDENGLRSLTSMQHLSGLKVRDQPVLA